MFCVHPIGVPAWGCGDLENRRASSPLSDVDDESIPDLVLRSKRRILLILARPVASSPPRGRATGAVAHPGSPKPVVGRGLLRVCEVADLDPGAHSPTISQVSV